MMQLHYFYVYRYKAIQNVGIRLNGRFEYKMDPDGKVLKVRENEKWTEGFWPEGVSSLTALVGSNGSGKTTFLEAILQMVEKGNNWEDVDAMVIYQVDK